MADGLQVPSMAVSRAPYQRHTLPNVQPQSMPA